MQIIFKLNTKMDTFEEIGKAIDKVISLISGLFN